MGRGAAEFPAVTANYSAVGWSRYGACKRDCYTPLDNDMVIHELTPAECAEVLSRANLARLACCRMNQPYIVPVSFAYDPRQACLFSFSAIGKKVEWMRENPSVCLEVEDVD